MANNICSSRFIMSLTRGWYLNHIRVASYYHLMGCTNKIIVEIILKGWYIDIQ